MKTPSAKNSEPSARGFPCKTFNDKLIAKHAGNLPMTLVGCLLLVGPILEPNTSRGAQPSAGYRTGLEPGIIAVKCSQTPAAFGFDQADGRIETCGERAGNVARAFIEPPDFGDRALEVSPGIAGFALAPFAAAFGALQARQDKLPPDKLAEREKELAQAMSEMAGQFQFRDCLLAVARQSGHQRFVPVESLTDTKSAPAPVAGYLETRIEDLRLRRMRSSDASCALEIQGRVRLLRAQDEVVIVDQPLQYRSGQALFIDWTLRDAFQKVTLTAYRKLAAQTVDRLVSATQGAPVFAGDGYDREAARRADKNVRPVAQRASDYPRPTPMFADYPIPESGIIALYSAATTPQITIQRPVAKGEAVSEAVREVEWSLDGLDDSRNIVVQLSACATAVPMSLWKQTVGALGGVSGRKRDAAEAQLAAASRQAPNYQELLAQVAQHLSGRTARPVLVMNGPFVPSARHQPVELAEVPSNGLVHLAGGPNTTTSKFHREAETVMEIKVLNAALKEQHGVNSPLALCVEVRVRLLRACDGAELCSWPVRYRSREQKFTAWAIQEARLFREELELCYRELSTAIADQYVARGFIPPSRQSYPVLAGKTD